MRRTSMSNRARDGDARRHVMGQLCELVDRERRYACLREAEFGMRVSVVANPDELMLEVARYRDLRYVTAHQRIASRAAPPRGDL